MKKNRWYKAITDVLEASDVSMTPEQIWAAMEKANFHHKSVSPRATLGARLAELVAVGKIEHAGRALYRKSVPIHQAPPVPDPMPEDLHSYN